MRLYCPELLRVVLVKHRHKLLTRKHFKLTKRGDDAPRLILQGQDVFDRGPDEPSCHVERHLERLASVRRKRSVTTERRVATAASIRMDRHEALGDLDAQLPLDLKDYRRMLWQSEVSTNKVVVHL
jgi:hypothetical protein